MASFRTDSAEEHIDALHTSDRCDRCGAAAYVRVELPLTTGQPTGVLLFCGHHYRQHETALLPVAGHVHDERSRLLAA